MRKIQWVILPVALTVSFILPSLTESISSILSPQREEGVRYVAVKWVGWRAGVAALFFRDPPLTEGQVALNVTRGLRCSLFRRNETPIVWLGSYKLRGVRIYDSARPSIVLELEEGGLGEAYALSGLRPGSEVYALLKRNGVTTFEFLFRTVGDNALIEIEGSAKGASRVTALAYAAAEDFNASQPLWNLYVTESEVVNGRFLLRMEKGGAPFTRQGRSLIEINSTLVLYAGCSYKVIDLTDYLASNDSVSLAVNLDCRNSLEPQAP